MFLIALVALVLNTATVPHTPETLEFRDFFERGTSELRPAARLLSLNGKRVRMVGFMAQMEEPPRGAFYLCSRPVFAAEGGAGTGDLPPDAVRVIVRSAKGQQLAFIPRALEVVGLLEVGSQADEDGGVSAIRLILDGPSPKPAGGAPLPASSPALQPTHSSER
jgi:hypothetical protein